MGTSNYFSRQRGALRYYSNDFLGTGEEVYLHCKCGCCDQYVTQFLSAKTKHTTCTASLLFECGLIDVRKEKWEVCLISSLVWGGTRTAQSVRNCPQSLLRTIQFFPCWKIVFKKLYVCRQNCCSEGAGEVGVVGWQECYEVHQGWMLSSALGRKVPLSRTGWGLSGWGAALPEKI